MKKELEVIKTKPIFELISSIVKDVEEGSINPIEAYSAFEYFNSALSDAKDKIKQNVIDEVEKEGNKTVRNGIEFSVREAGVKYGYNVSSSWSNYQSQINSLKEQQKNLETMLKAASESHPFVDAQTGEVITAIPKSSTTTVVCKILDKDK